MTVSREEQPTLEPDAYGSLLDVREVSVLPDKGVGALVETFFPAAEPGVQVDFISFVDEEGRWLIDAIVEDLEEQYPPEAATPAAKNDHRRC